MPADYAIIDFSIVANYNSVHDCRVRYNSVLSNAREIVDA
jgi:hypothetical protein